MGTGTLPPSTSHEAEAHGQVQTGSLQQPARGWNLYPNVYPPGNLNYFFKASGIYSVGILLNFPFLNYSNMQVTVIANKTRGSNSEGGMCKVATSQWKAEQGQM